MFSSKYHLILAKGLRSDTIMGINALNLPKQEGGTSPEISNSPSLQVAVSLPARLYPV